MNILTPVEVIQTAYSHPFPLFGFRTATEVSLSVWNPDVCYGVLHFHEAVFVSRTFLLLFVNIWGMSTDMSEKRWGVTCTFQAAFLILNPSRQAKFLLLSSLDWESAPLFPPSAIVVFFFFFFLLNGRRWEGIRRPVYYHHCINR